jgi:hypothetical protein
METSPATAPGVPRLRRTLTLWDLIFYGIVLIQPIAPVPLYGVAQKLSDGHFVTIILIALFAMLITAVSYGRMGAVPERRLGLHVRRPGAEPASGISGGMGRDPGLLAAAADQHSMDVDGAARALPAADSIYCVGGAHCRDHDRAQSGRNQVIGAGQQGSAGGDVGSCGLLRVACDSMCAMGKGGPACCQPSRSTILGPLTPIRS